MFAWVKSQGKEYAPVLVRISLALVFLWFGVMQLWKPQNFVGYLPEFLFDQPYSELLVMGNGAFEIVFGVLLLIGFLTRLSALLLGLHLAVLTIEFLLSFGFTNEVFARDFGLTLATLAVFLHGPDKFCIDKNK